MAEEEDTDPPTGDQPSLQSTEQSAASVRVSGETPLKPDELRHIRAKWSLAGDAGLLLYLQDFSQRILSKTTDIEKVVGNLSNSAKGSHAKVYNTFNEFLMLSSNQFIENRVYDEEVVPEEPSEKDAPEKQEKSREALESEIVPRFSDAVKHGLGVLEDAFITVEVKPEDESEDEDGESLPSGYTQDPIIEPKDLYSDRPLPYLIGSAEFLHDDSLGLIIKSSDDEEDENANEEDEKSESESEASDEEIATESDTETESSDEDMSTDEEIAKPTPKQKQVSSDEDSDDEDLFGEPKDKIQKMIDSDSESETEAKPAPPRGIQAELAAKLGAPRRPPSESSDTKSTASEWDTESVKADTVSIASTKSKKPKQVDDTVSVTSKVSKKGKHRDRSQSIQSKISRKSVKESSKKKKKPAKTAEEEDDEDLFAPKKDDGLFEDSGAFGSKGGMFSGGGSLFDDHDDDDEGDLFGEVTPKKESPKIETVAEQAIEEDSDIPVKPRTRTMSSGKKLPAGAVSMFGNLAPGGLFGEGGSPKKTNLPKEETPKSPEKQAPPEVKGFFDDEGDDEGMFKSGNKDSLDLPAETRPRKKTLTLFDDSEQDDLFGGSEKSKKTQAKDNKVPEQKKVVETAKPVQEKAAPKKQQAKGGLFGADSEEEDLFASGSKPNSAKPPTQTSTAPSRQTKQRPSVISLFDDEDDDAGDDDLFKGLSVKKSNAARSSNNSSTKTEVPKKSVTKKQSSLFDEDEDELFSTPITTPKFITPSDTPTNATPIATPPPRSPVATKKDIPSVKESKHKEKSLFGDDEDLFASKENKPPSKPVNEKVAAVAEVASKQDPFGLEGSDDEMFGTSKPAKAAPKTTSSGKKVPAGAVSIFGDLDGGGLFGKGSPPKKQSSKAEPVKSEEKKTISDIKKAPSLFSDDDEGDLFSVSKPKTPSSVHPAKAKPVETPKQTLTKAAVSDPLLLTDPNYDSDIDADFKAASSKSSKYDPVFDSDFKRPDEEMEAAVSKPRGFSSELVNPTEDKRPISDEPQEQPSKIEAPKPKKPVGGVSMFGGFDPLAALHKSGTSPTKGDTDIVDNVTKERDSGPSKSTIAGKVNDTKESDVLSFDAPAEVNTLQSVAKNRARGQAKRRPPTRNARKAAATDNDLVSGGLTSTDNSLQNDNSLTTTIENPVAGKKDTVISNDNVQKVSESSKVDKDDIFSVSGTSSNPLAEDDTDDILATEKRTALSKNDKSKKPVGGVSMFGGIDPLSALKKSPKTDTDVIAPENHQNDSLAPEVTPPQQLDTSSASSDTTSKTESDIGDIFANTNKPVVSKTDKNKSIFAEKDDSDDDLFGTKPKKSELSKSKQKVVKKQTDDDLFGNSGSIFDDVPSTSKTKKKKKNKTEITGDIFAESNEDIFGDSASTTKKPKAKKKAEKKASSVKSTDIFDDNNSSIFDDPLNALGGQ